MELIDIILHLDQHLQNWIQFFGPWIYVVLFVIIFAETGFVVTPFLPGDSLLFALGALAAMSGSILNVNLLFVLLSIAAITGNITNYVIGRKLGPKVFSSQSSKFLNKEYLEKTHTFYEKYGAIAVILSRYAPILRTFVPFVAGIGKMDYKKFVFYTVVGGITWIAAFLYAGYYFGNMPQVKANFHILIIGILVISVMPAVIGWFKIKFSKST